MKRLHIGVAIIIVVLTMAISCYAEYDSSVIQQVQEALNNAGFDCGTPDGIAGSGTSTAVISYQEANGLTVDGQISDALLVSLGLKEAEVVETEQPDPTTEAAPVEEPLVEEAVQTAETTAAPSQPEERVVLDLNGQFDGNTPGGHRFLWFEDSKVIYYDGNKVYGIVPDNGDLKYVRFAEDGESFAWEKVVETPEEYADMGECMYLLFIFHRDSFTKDHEITDAIISDKLMEQKFTAPEVSEDIEREETLPADGFYDGNLPSGNVFKWYKDRKVIYYLGTKVYGILTEDDELKMVRFKEDWNDYYWEISLSYNESPMLSCGENMYELFTKKIEEYEKNLS